MLLSRWHLEVTNYAIRKQKLCRKRDKPLRMGFCRKAPPIEDAFGSYKLEKKKKTEDKLRFPSPSPTLEIMEEATATSFPGFSPTRFTEREREREREPGNEVEAAAEDAPFFHSSLLTRELIKPISRRWKKSAIFYTSTQPCEDQNKNRTQEC